MRIVKVWLYAIFYMATITAVWWLSQPIILSVAAAWTTTVEEALLVIRTASFVSAVWGPFLDCVILAWALLNSQKKDVESELY